MSSLVPGNVHAAGLGFRVAGGRVTSELAVRVYVLRKLPKGLVGADHLIPASVDGVPVDVVEAPVPATASGTNTEWTRPLRMGYSAAHLQVGAGTMGAIVVRQGFPGSKFLLSCSHVLAPPGAKLGDAVQQPARLDDYDSTPDPVATLSAFTGVALGNAHNRVDAAIAKLDTSIGGTNELGDLGRLDPANTLPDAGSVIGQPIRVGKLGRTTGYTEGVIDDWHWQGAIHIDTPHGQRMAWYAEQFRVVPQGGFFTFSDAGDSGAMVVQLGTQRAIGMLVAGEFGATIVTPICNVLSIPGCWELRFIDS